MLKFRFHAGSLERSLMTVQEFKTLDDLIKIINDYHTDMHLKVVTKDTILIKHYASDTRCAGWLDTCSVSFTEKNQLHLPKAFRKYCISGFCNGMPEDYVEES